jgi:hypothetical protein
MDPICPDKKRLEPGLGPQDLGPAGSAQAPCPPAGQAPFFLPGVKGWESNRSTTLSQIGNPLLPLLNSLAERAEGG